MTNKDKADSSVLGGVPSDDDDDDEDWNSRRNNKKKDKNGSKKNRGWFDKHEKPVKILITHIQVPQKRVWIKNLLTR